jgi:NAD(P) transhydrogenase subunit beta
MVVLFVVALWRMSHPLTARSGIVWAGAGVLIAIAVTFFAPGMGNFALIGLGIVVGGLAGWYTAARVQMTAMPQMVATFNGMGGGAAAAIAAVVLIPGGWSLADASLSIAGAVIGSVSFTGSIIAFLKLQGWMPQRAIVYPGQQPTNLVVLGAAIVLGVVTVAFATTVYLVPFFVLALAFGFLMTVPIGGADMPVVISFYNALTGVAVAMDGIAIGNFAMIVAGTLVGAAGSLLTLLMARAMNRSLGNVVFGAFGAKEEAAGAIAGSMKAVEADDVAAMLAYANKVVVAPGYGLAVSQAQGKVKELADLLEQKGVEVKFAIHPVAGRMPGHMNVLLAESGVPYEKLFDRDEIDAEFPSTDVVLVIGANDVVNPAARRQGSPLFGMPILDVDQAKNIVVLKRGQGRGFAGIENELFYKDNTRMLYGDAQESLSKLVQALKRL